MRPARCLSQLFMSCLTLNRLSYAQTDARSTTDPEATTSVDVGNNPSKDEFLRRSDFIAAKIGDYVYFDGGEGSQKNGGRFTNPINATLSIDVGKSWEVENVEIMETAYGSVAPQVTLFKSVFVNNESDSFYTWGGRTSFGEPQIETNFWRFDADGSGGGEWVDVTPSDKSDTFFDLKRSSAASWTSTDDAGFIFGGNVYGSTELEAERKGGAGYRTFNFTTQEWNEYYDTPYSEKDGLLFKGSALFVPDFGPNGFIFLLGGFLDDTDPKSGLDFRTLHFLDPVERKWYNQTTTGKVPGGRASACVVGASTDDGRFDIFLFGGSDMSSSDFSDVYVLTLPGFHWTLASGPEDPEYRRSRHVCASLGRRQFISFGGRREYGINETESWQTPDPFPQGIGIYDMSAWAWDARYDAEANPYEQHSDLRAWYNDGGLDDVTWSDGVGELFVSSDSGSSGGSRDDSGDNKQDGGSDAGIIAGSTVGGVAVIALAIGIWFFWRRRQRRKQVSTIESTPGGAALMMEHAPSKAGSPPVPSYYESGYYNTEPNSGAYPVELMQESHELADTRPQLYEMGDSERR